MLYVLVVCNWKKTKSEKICWQRAPTRRRYRAPIPCKHKMVFDRFHRPKKVLTDRKKYKRRYAASSFAHRSQLVFTTVNVLLFVFERNPADLSVARCWISRLFSPPKNAVSTERMTIRLSAEYQIGWLQTRLNKDWILWEVFFLSCYLLSEGRRPSGMHF